MDCVQSDAEGLGGEGSWSDLVEPRYRRMMVLGTGLALLQQASGINSITFYSSSVSAAALLLPLLLLLLLLLMLLLLLLT